MSVSIIDGTLETVTATKRGKIVRLKDVKFRKADGTEEALAGLFVATGAVGEALQPGLRGRFYLYKAIDHKGIHAVRPAGGKVIAVFPTTNETLMAILFAINVVWVALMVALRDGVPLLGVALIALSAVLFFLYRAVRKEAQAQIAADNPPGPA